MILLDSNICIELMNQNQKAINEFKKTEFGNVAIPEIVRAELYYGAYLSNRKTENLDTVDRLLFPLKMIAMNRQASLSYAQIRVELKQKGQMIGANDLVIAAIALAGNHILVSNNTREFARVSGLKLVDWLA
ncbi:MAG TPA: type II toxin-antitoxin system VapC family toxin [Trueperaceae bacterium]|nr:type II toxin-antitoxin system VapC family toxin [Trueperaceae bacterium]